MSSQKRPDKDGPLPCARSNTFRRSDSSLGWSKICSSCSGCPCSTIGGISKPTCIPADASSSARPRRATHLSFTLPATHLVQIVSYPRDGSLLPTVHSSLSRGESAAIEISCPSSNRNCPRCQPVAMQSACNLEGVVQSTHRSWSGKSLSNAQSARRATLPLESRQVHPTERPLLPGQLVRHPARSRPARTVGPHAALASVLLVWKERCKREQYLIPAWLGPVRL